MRGRPQPQTPVAPTSLVHSVRGIDFLLTPNDALERIHTSYESDFFGLSPAALQLGVPSREFFPLYLCDGRMSSTFKATAICVEEGVAQGEAAYGSSSDLPSRESETAAENVVSQEATRRREAAERAAAMQTTRRVKKKTCLVSTGPHKLDATYSAASHQVYAGDHCDVRAMYDVLMHEANALVAKKFNLVNLSAKPLVHEFVVPVEILTRLLRSGVVRRAEAKAKAVVAGLYPTATRIEITFEDKVQTHLEEVTPLYVPCYVVKGDYEGEMYTFFVNGVSGKVIGPSLYHAQKAAVAAALSVGAASVVLNGSYHRALVVGIVLAAAVFVAAKKVPSFFKDRSEENGQQAKNRQRLEKITGFRPTLTSRRTEIAAKEK